MRLLGEQEGLLPNDFLVLMLELDEFFQFFLHDFAFLVLLNLLLFLFRIKRVQLDWLGQLIELFQFFVFLPPGTGSTVTRTKRIHAQESL